MAKSNFHLVEFFPKCSTKEIFDVLLNKDLSRNLVRLYTAVSQLRLAFGQPFIITSGYRNETRNLFVHGSKNSQHLTCEAVDFYPEDFTLCEDLIFFLRKPEFSNRFGQVIYYPQYHFIHLALPCAKYSSITFFENVNNLLSSFNFEAYGKN